MPTQHSVRIIHLSSLCLSSSLTTLTLTLRLLFFDRARTRQARQASKQATNYASIIIFYTIFRFTPKKNAIPYYLPTVTAKQNSIPAHAVLLFNAINKNNLLGPRSTQQRHQKSARSVFTLPRPGVETRSSSACRPL
jgi:hypothetical protein